MSNEIILAIETVSAEIDVDPEVIYSAMESGLASVIAKGIGEDVQVRVEVDRDTGDYIAFHCRNIVDLPKEEIANTDMDISLAEAHSVDKSLEVGDVVEELLPAEEFGRIAAHHAKQVIVRVVRDAERMKIMDAYKKRQGEVLTASVKRVTKDSITVDLGENAEGLMPRDELIPTEKYRQNDRIRCYIVGVRDEMRGPQVLVSRGCAEFLIELFKVEVPEIGEQIIEIKAAARDPGSRAKIAVKTNDGRIDPIGACVGMRGSRVQAVSGELNGERIDIVLWDDNPAQLVINAMAPAEVSSIVVDENSHVMDVIVEESQLAQAIGRSGQNVRLASELTGWMLNIMTPEEAQVKAEEESRDALSLFTEKLDVDEEIAAVLVREGFGSLEEVAYVDIAEMASIEEFDDEIVDALRERAKTALLARVISGEDQPPAEDLLVLEGMNDTLAKALAQNGVVTREDLAEQATDDLMDMQGFSITKEEAAALIMKAREHWFASSEETK